VLESENSNGVYIVLDFLSGSFSIVSYETKNSGGILCIASTPSSTHFIDTMELAEFPTEILHLVLVYAALGRGFKRAVRFRVVCKAFASLVYPALFETHLMDRLIYTSYSLGTRSWRIWNQHGTDRL
jgi:hypothetical protein